MAALPDNPRAPAILLIAIGSHGAAGSRVPAATMRRVVSATGPVAANVHDPRGPTWARGGLVPVVARRVALRIALAYAAFAAAWILLSDRAVTLLGLGAAAEQAVQSGKGLAFVLVTSLLLFLSVRRQVLQVRRVDEARVVAERRYHEIFDASADVQLVVDATGRILEANDAALQRYGYSRAELLALSVRELASPRRIDELPAAFAAALQHARSFEWLHRARDGREIPVEIHATPVTLDGQPRIYATVRDISERKRHEDERAHREDELERRVAERTEELEHEKQRAEAADRVKSAFLATMSHELRTPLNSIIGFSGLVHDEVPGPLNLEQKKQIGMVLSSARHLLSLINDVLDLSKVEAGQLTVERAPVPVDEAVRAAIASVAQQFADKGVLLEAHIESDGIVALGDRRRFDQVLLNLLSNALKFTERGHVEVSVRRAGSAVEARVTDTGIGIAASELSSLFVAFHQVDARTARRFEGTGLGLAISKRLVGAMGGAMGVESTLGEGSSFWFTLPAATDDDEHTA